MESNAHRHDGLAPGALSAAERADMRWGIERVLARHAEAPPPRDLARTLQRALRHLPVVTLHDRLLPDGAIAEHVAVGPGGVTIISGWRIAEVVQPLVVERLRGMFGARADLLRDGAREDRTALVAPLRERVAGVRAVIEDYVDVAGALCLDGDPESDVAPLAPLVVEGILIGGPKAVAELVARDGDLHDYELAALVDLLDGALPPAGLLPS